MQHRPEVRLSYRDIPREEWTKDEFTYNQFTMAMDELEDVQTRFRQGKVELYDIQRLGWVSNWVADIIKDIAWTLWQEEGIEEL